MFVVLCDLSKLSCIHTCMSVLPTPAHICLTRQGITTLKVDDAVKYSSPWNENLLQFFINKAHGITLLRAFIHPAPNKTKNAQIQCPFGQTALSPFPASVNKNTVSYTTVEQIW